MVHIEDVSPEHFVCTNEPSFYAFEQAYFLAHVTCINMQPFSGSELGLEFLDCRTWHECMLVSTTARDSVRQYLARVIEDPPTPGDGWTGTNNVCSVSMTAFFNMLRTLSTSLCLMRQIHRLDGKGY